MGGMTRLSPWLLALSLLVACGGDAATGTTGSGGGGATSSSSAGGTDGGGGEGGVAPGPCDLLADSFDAALGAANDAEGLAGGTVAAVETASCGLWTGAAGEADDGVAMKTTSLLRVGSVTKTYVSAALVALADEGALSLDDTLSSFVTTGVENEDVITVRQLLNHTAGVFNYTEDGVFMNEVVLNPSMAYTPQQIVDVAVAHGAEFEPGTSWSYSNTGYILLGMVLETVTGESAGAHLRVAMLDPQGLDRTFFDGEEALPEPLAKGYGPNGEDLTAVLHPSVPWTAGIMVAEAGDLARWATALYDGDAISEAARAEMLTFVPGENYGLGVVQAFTSSGSVGYGHGGGIPGYQSVMLYFPELEASVAVVVNHQLRDPSNALLALLDELPAP